jgi:hypothetical protein
MSWGREKQNAVSKYPVAVSNQSHPVAYNGPNRDSVPHDKPEIREDEAA